MIEHDLGTVRAVLDLQELTFNSHRVSVDNLAVKLPDIFDDIIPIALM